jgi:hypothetical protein
MRLTRITITGADDEVDPRALLDLSSEFPYVEWGVLRGGQDRLGTRRYPMPEWVSLLHAVAQVSRMRWSLHLCGELARHAMAGSPTVFAAIKSLSAQRVQLNGFSKYRLPMLVLAQLLPDVEFILQCQSDDALLEAEKIHHQHDNVSALWDTSGGRGCAEAWDEGGAPCVVSPNSVRLGWAGGIREDNIVDCIKSVLEANDLPTLRNVEGWVDIETGARTDDHFNLVKVRRLLELAKPFVSTPGGEA